MALIYLIRHAKPAVTWGDLGEPDPGLGEIGLGQAKAAAGQLMDLPPSERPSAVVSSPLRRCRETAAPFASLLGVPVTIEEGVGEIPTPASLAFEDRPTWLYASLAGRWDEIEGDADYPAWRDAVVETVKRYPGAAIFSHFVAINAVAAVLLDDPRTTPFHPDHASITRLELVDGRLILLEKGREAETGVL